MMGPGGLSLRNIHVFVLFEPPSIGPKPIALSGIFIQAMLWALIEN